MLLRFCRLARLPRCWGGLVLMGGLGLLGSGCGQVIRVETVQSRPSLLHRIESHFQRRSATAVRTPLGPAVGGAVPDAPGTLHGASTSFTNALADVWQNALAGLPGQAISYDSVDSRADVQEVLQGNAGFAISEIPLTPNQLEEGKIKLQEMPVGAGPICIVYNLPELSLPLKLTPGVLAKIYLGEITSWNDALVRAANPNVAMPNINIVTVHRAHPAGSTYVFSHYLAAVDRQWAGIVDSSDDIAQWPAEGRSGSGDEGVLDAVMHVPGGIGYAECGFAQAKHVAVARIENQSGNFAPPTVPNVAAAMNAFAPGLEKDPLLPIVNAPSADAYPMVGAVYLIFPHPERGPEPALTFARWVLGPGQTLSGQVGIAPLPPVLLQQQRALLGMTTAPTAVAVSGLGAAAPKAGIVH